MDNNKQGAVWFLFEALRTGSQPDAILNQEARGQEQLVHSDILPKEALAYRIQLEALGFQFGDPVDDLFIACTLPTGWHKEGTGYSMWSTLKDDKGRNRASIGYKAAFYDRWASFSLSRRFSCTSRPLDGDYAAPYESIPYEGVVCDGEQVIYKTDPVMPTEELPGRSIREMQKLHIVQWLNERYPDWESPFAYWDE